MDASALHDVSSGKDWIVGKSAYLAIRKELEISVGRTRECDSLVGERSVGTGKVSARGWQQGLAGDREAA
jgi:uncharacterized protein (AIM24 family)